MSGAAGMIKVKSISMKVLISLFIIIALTFGLSQGIKEAAPGQTATGQVTIGQKNDNENNIEISAPQPIAGWKLEPGIVNEQKGTLHVKAKGSWQIKISADEATSGYMKEYIPASAKSDDGDHNKVEANGAYVKDGKTLINSLKVKAEGYNEVDLKDGGVLINYKDGGQGNAFQTFDIPIIFRQEISWDDALLSNGHVYHITIDFNPS
jgi:hypothetical protein